MVYLWDAGEAEEAEGEKIRWEVGGREEGQGGEEGGVVLDVD